MQRIRENVKVAAIFAPGDRIRPVWFEWRRQKHSITETCYFWKDRVGSASRHHFAVSDGINLFELAYDTCNQVWTVEGVQEKDR